MYTSTILLSLLPVALAQYGGGSSDSSTTSSAAAAASSAATPAGVQVVKVGNLKGDLTFTPDTITAAAGTKVEFVFYPATHSVAQASFASPCEPLNTTVGFFSGPIMTTTGPNTDQVFTITVNDTKPIWFYCGFPGHCQKGMVGVINAPADGSKTLDQFKTAAASVDTTVAPKSVGGGVIGAQSAVQGTGTASGSSPTSTPPNAGMESRGAVKWSLMGLAGLLAVGFGGLIL